jgi:hypothetical protein
MTSQRSSRRWRDSTAEEAPEDLSSDSTEGSDHDDAGVVASTKRLRPPSSHDASTKTGQKLYYATTIGGWGEVAITTIRNDLEADLPTVVVEPHEFRTLSVQDLEAGLRMRVPVGLARLVVALSAVCGVLFIVERVLEVWNSEA